MGGVAGSQKAKLLYSKLHVVPALVPPLPPVIVFRPVFWSFFIKYFCRASGSLSLLSEM